MSPRISTRRTSAASERLVIPELRTPVGFAQYYEALSQVIGDFTNTDKIIPHHTGFSIGVRDISTSNDTIEVYSQTVNYRYSVALVQFYGTTQYKFIVHVMPTTRSAISVSPTEVVDVLNAVFLVPLFPGRKFTLEDGIMCCYTNTVMIPTKVFHTKSPQPFPLFHQGPIVDLPNVSPIRGVRVQQGARWNTRTLGRIESEPVITRLAPSEMSNRVVEGRIRSAESTFNPDAEIPEV